MLFKIDVLCVEKYIAIRIKNKHLLQRHPPKKESRTFSTNKKWQVCRLSASFCKIIANLQKKKHLK